jgi:FkbM family methyltransferase
MELVSRVSTAVGRSPAARLAANVLVTAFRSLRVGQSWVQTTTAAIADGGRAGALVVRVALPGRRFATLECDLRFEAYRQVALFPESLESNPELRLFAALARHARLVIDAGANAGLFSYAAAAADPSVRVTAIEPIPELAARLRANLARNGWADRIAVHEALVSDRQGVGRLFVAQSDMESTMEAHRAARQAVRATIECPMMTLDEVLLSAAVEPGDALIKIDVEGHERAALNGLAGALANRRRPELFVEFLGDALSGGIIDRTIAAGYDTYYVCGSRLIELRSTAAFLAHQDLSCWNFLCSTRPRDRVLQDAAAAGLTSVPA